jgi:hypothetical protein
MTIIRLFIFGSMIKFIFMNQFLKESLLLVDEDKVKFENRIDVALTGN